MFWLCSGFMGLHRFYLEERVGLHLHPGVPAHPLHEGEIRERREDVSRTRAAVESSHVEVNRAKPSVGETPTAEATDRLGKAQAAVSKAEAEFARPRPISTERTATRAGSLCSWPRC